MVDDLIKAFEALDLMNEMEGRNNMCIENLFRCLSDVCLVDIYQDSILLYTGDAYDIPIGLMNANIKEIKPGYDPRKNEHSIEIILLG